MGIAWGPVACRVGYRGVQMDQQRIVDLDYPFEQRVIVALQGREAARVLRRESVQGARAAQRLNSHDTRLTLVYRPFAHFDPTEGDRFGDQSVHARHEMILAHAGDQLSQFDKVGLRSFDVELWVLDSDDPTHCFSSISRNTRTGLTRRGLGMATSIYRQSNCCKALKKRF